MAQNLTDSLVAFYPFAGNTLDVSGNNNHGTAMGAVLIPDRFGNPNSAYGFNGVNQSIQLLATPKLKMTTFPFSVTFWVNVPLGVISPPAAPFNLISNDNNANGLYNGFWMNLLAGQSQICISYGDGGPCTGSGRRSKLGVTPLNDGQWHMVTGVVRGATDMDLYVDCVDDGGVYSGSGGALAVSAQNQGNVGSFYCGIDQYHFQGSIDEIRVYHRELKQADVVALYNLGSTQAVNILGNDTTMCSGGAITLTANVANANAYLWSNGSTGNSISVTQSGTYWVTAYSLNSCSTLTDSINISIINPIPSISGPTTYCITNLQPLFYTAPAGNYQYNWTISGGILNGATNQSTASVNWGSSGGILSLTVTDASGCSGQTSLSVIPVSVPAQIAGYQEVCNLANTYLYHTNSTGLSYSWTAVNGTIQGSASQASVSVNWTSLPAQLTLTVTNPQTNCSSTNTISISEGSLVGTTISGSSVICSNSSTPVNYGVPNNITVGNWVAIGGTILGSNTQSSVSVQWTNLPGMLIFNGTNDATGCPVQDTISVISGNTLTVDAGADIHLCPEQNQVQLSVTANANGIYIWSPSNLLSGATTATPTAFVNQNTTFYVSFQSDGCVVVDTVEVAFFQSPVVDAGMDKTVCKQTCTQLQATGASAYSWFPTPFLSQNNIPNPLACPNQSTVYYVIGTDENGCKDQDSVLISVIAPPVLCCSETILICPDQAATLTVTVPPLQGFSPSILWTTGDTTATITVNPSVSTNYWAVALIPLEGCKTDTVWKKVKIVPMPVAAATFTYDKCQFPTRVVFENTSTDATAFLWSFGDGQNNSSQPTPTHLYDAAGTYDLMLIAYNDGGCQDTLFHEDAIKILSNDLFIPNAFSPNQDGINDAFSIKGMEFSAFEIQIFNRWGIEIFHSTDANFQWDGTYNKSHKDVPEGVYVYRILYQSECSNGAKDRSGSITLIR